MCRLLVARANRPTRLTGSLLTAPHSLITQSCCDKEEGACHQDGWGIGYLEADQLRRVRSTKAAAGDPEYRALAENVASTMLLAHVRRASSGSVVIQNSHPFTFGRWIFCHNGNLGGFGAGRERLLARIPADLREHIEGKTDSEHAFFFVLDTMRRALGRLDQAPPPRRAANAFADSILELAQLFPGEPNDPSQFNFVLSDGHLVLAARWGHALSWLRRRGTGADGLDHAADNAGTDSVIIASEPTSSEAWVEVPERTMLGITPDLETFQFPLDAKAENRA